MDGEVVNDCDRDNSQLLYPRLTFVFISNNLSKVLALLSTSASTFKCHAALSPAGRCQFRTTMTKKNPPRSTLETRVFTRRRQTLKKYDDICCFRCEFKENKQVFGS